MGWKLRMGVVLVMLPLGLALAQSEGPQADKPSVQTPSPASESPDAAAPSGDPTAERVLNELLRRRSENPLIEPARPRGGDGGVEGRAARPLGTAPGVGEADLKREGQFVVLRRGRMMRATGGASPWLFVFDADRNNLDDPPMYLMPCRMLEDMEQIVEDRGEAVPFIISGQVFVYKNANYLLPTLMKLAPDRGNLEP